MDANIRINENERVKLIRAIINRFAKSKNINNRYSSARLKGIIDFELSHQTMGFFYKCYELELIEGMIAAGFIYNERSGKCYFNVTQGSINAIKHISPYPSTTLKNRYRKHWTRISRKELQAVGI